MNFTLFSGKFENKLIWKISKFNLR